jgi:hypothetical protein
MQRREGRMAAPEAETPTRGRLSYTPVSSVRTVERAIFLVALVAILMLGAIGGLNALIGIYTD